MRNPSTCEREFVWWLWKLQTTKRINSTDHEKTSYASILDGKDVIGDDYDVNSHCDFVKALLSNFMEKNEKDSTNCVEGWKHGNGNNSWVLCKNLHVICIFWQI